MPDATPPQLDPKSWSAQICERIDRADPVVRAFVGEPGRADRLTAAAEALNATPGAVELPLYGVPFGVKDIVRADGLPTLAGSRLPAAALAGPQATAVSRLLAAGALPAGKTHTAEFAVSVPGPTRNPRDPQHTAGESSSGSAAAVAAGMVPLAIGTQTVGSAIRPAAYCGVTGYVVSHGRVPMDGVLPVAPSLDTLGLFAPGVAGVARAAACLLDDWQAPAGTTAPPVLGVPDGPYLRRAEPEARAAFERQADALRAAGYTVRRVPLFEDFDKIAFRLLAIDVREMADAHAGLLAQYEHLYQEGTLAPIRTGRSVRDEDYAKVLAFRAGYIEQLAATAAGHGIDLWIAPAATGPAPHGHDDSGDASMSLPWSGAGLPCVTLPAGHAPGTRLPLGLQLVGTHGGDELLLRWAAAVENVLSPAREA